MHLFRTPLEAMAFLNKQRENLGITYGQLSRKLDMDPERVSKLLNGKPNKNLKMDRAFDNTFMAQCFADVIGFDLTVRISRDGNVLSDSCTNRDIGRAFKEMRILSGIGEGQAAVALQISKRALLKFEDGRIVDVESSWFDKSRSESEGAYFSHDKLCRWAAALGGSVDIVLREKNRARSGLRAA